MIIVVVLLLLLGGDGSASLVVFQSVGSAPMHEPSFAKVCQLQRRHCRRR